MAEESRANDVQRRNVTSRYASINCSHKEILKDRWKRHTAPSMSSLYLLVQAESTISPSKKSLRRSQSQSRVYSVHRREPHSHRSPPLLTEECHLFGPHSLARTLDQVSYCAVMTPFACVIKFKPLSLGERTPSVYRLSLGAADKRCSTLRLSRLTSQAILQPCYTPPRSRRRLRSH